jgi:tetratricopeptide (TPR) repeat protein
VEELQAEVEEGMKREDEILATETVAQLQPVIEAIHHSVQGNAVDQAWIFFRVYLQRGSREYLWSRLGAYDTALATLISLFPDGDLSRAPDVSPQTVSTVLNTTALALGHTGRVREAVRLYERALDGCDANDHASIFRLALNLLDAHLDLGDIRAATSYLERAGSLSDSVDDEDDMTDLAVAVANVEDFRGSTDVATDVYQHLHAGIPQDESYRKIRFSFMQHLIQVGDLEVALRFAQMALAIYSRIDRRPDQARAKRVLGTVQMLSGATDDALTMLREASAEAEAVGDFRVRLDALIVLARAEARYGSAEAAASAADVALRMARQGELRPREMQALISSGWLHIRRGDLTEASRIAAMVLEQSSTMEYAEGVKAAEELTSASAASTAHVDRPIGV